MNLSTIFQISIYGLLCLSSVIFGVAEEAAISPQVLTVPLALVAFFFNERWKTIVLPMFWTNLFGLLAFGAAIIEFFGENLEGRLLAGAHLLVYLTWIVLFQTKTPRQYWWMCALGLLQISVASVLTSEVWFGVSLGCYMVLAIWTLSVFSLHQAQQRFEKAEHLAIQSPLAGSSITVDHSVISSDASQATMTGIRENAGQIPWFRQPSRTRGSIQHNLGEKWINGRFACGVLGTTTFAFLVGAVFFLFIPRLWIGQRGGIQDNSIDDPLPQLTGFTEEVQLGDLGEILESTERVLDVRLYENGTDRPIDIEDYARRLGYDEPMFRGSVMARYQNGSWKADLGNGRIGEFIRGRRLSIPEDVRQEIVLVPSGTPILFAIHPMFWCEFEHSEHNAEIHTATFVLFRPRSISAKEPLSYRVYSHYPERQNSLPTLYQGHRFQSAYLQLPSTGLERLKRLANDLCRTEDESSPLSQKEMAVRLESFLKDSNRFSYSLNASIEDPSIDPIEDFLFNRKSGHCEYFGSALALMLRAVGIPSRLISGFKGGETNQFNGNYVVQQRHAHAWVETLIDGRWTVLDPTPVERLQSVQSFATSRPALDDFTEMLSTGWSQQIIRLSLTEQQVYLYGPLRRFTAAWLGWLGDTIWEHAGPLRFIWKFVRTPSRWFSWQGGMIAFCLLLSLCFIAWVIMQLTRAFRLLFSRRGSRRFGKRIQIDFYERFQKLLFAHGLIRNPMQTQREFAAIIQQSCINTLQPSGLTNCPFDVVDLFYRVRFGQKELSSVEKRDIDQLLTRLEQCLTNSNGQTAISHE